MIEDNSNLVVESWWQLRWQYLKDCFRPRYRAATPTELQLARDLQASRQEAAALREQLTAIKIDLECRDARIRVHELSISCLTEVIERDRRRVEAETSASLVQINRARVESKPT